jgi:class 3 adenylate cyclase
MRQEYPSSQDLSARLPWAGRFHVLRLVLVAMVLTVAAAQVGICGRLTGFHVVLFGFGLAYPFLVGSLLGRLEGRRRHGRISLLLDGFFAGALVPAIAFEPVASAVIAIISLFNWLAVGGIAFATRGAMALLVGLGVSAAVLGVEQVRSCGPAGWLAYGILLVYLPFVAWVMHRHASALRLRCDELQMDRDRAETARRQSDRALLAVLPDSAAREMAETGAVAQRSWPDAVLLLGALRTGAGSAAKGAWFGEVLSPVQEILRRHGLELAKVFGGRFLALAGPDAGVNQAVAASREIAAYFRNHGGSGPDGGPEWPLCMVVHCGPIESGLLPGDALCFDVVGEPLEEAMALAARWDAPGVLVSSAARHRLQGEWRFQYLGEEGLPVFLLAEREGGRADLAGAD